MSRFFAVFIALSLLFGPLSMDRAMAATTTATHGQMSEAPKATAGHCQQMDQGKPDKVTSKPCCAAMCATAAIIPQAAATEQLFDRLSALPAPSQFHRGILSKIATPPPRIA